MKKKVFYVLLALVVLCSCQGFGDPIGFNIAGNDAADRLEGETADGCSLWTDVYGSDENAIADGTGLVLNGTGGLVTADWSSSNLWQHGPNGTSYEQIFHKWLDDGDPIVVTFNGLNDWAAASGYGGAYTIRIYQNTDWSNNNFPAIDITDGTNLLETVQAANFDHSDGTRAYCDTGLLTADSVVLELGPRDLNNNARSPFSAAKITLIDKFRPVDPDPEVGLEVPPSQILSWEQLSLANGLGVTYDVYFGTDANELSPSYYYGLPPVKTTTDNPADFFYDPALDNSETYYWRVVAIDPNGGVPTPHAGPEWWFTTQPASPVIQTDPVSQTVALGATEAVLSVAGINIETYQWYKDGAPLADDLTDTLYVGQDTATLTIYDVQVADEGDYYCVGDNSLIQPDTSDVAQLITKRLIGWWKLDGDLTDSIDTLYPDAVVHDGVSPDPNYAIGIDSSAIEFEGNTEDVVTFPDSADFFNCFVRGFTVSAWVNMPFKNGSWETMVTNEGQGDSLSGYMLNTTGTGTAVYTLRQSFGDLYGNTDLDTSSWRLFVGTYDAVTGEGKVYIDGVLMNQATSTGVVTPSPGDLLFGGRHIDPTVYTGLLDDVRIYSYAADVVEIASLYTSFNPGVDICVVNPDFDVAGPDGVGDEYRDCKVDLYDFAVFTQEWLECNVVPTCLP